MITPPSLFFIYLKMRGTVISAQQELCVKVLELPSLLCLILMIFKLMDCVYSRNDPNVEALSQMSPWVNHGQVYIIYFMFLQHINQVFIN